MGNYEENYVELVARHGRTGSFPSTKTTACRFPTGELGRSRKLKSHFKRRRPGEVREKWVFDELQGSERTLQQERKSSKNEDDVPWIRCTLFRKYRLSETPKRRHKG